MSDHISVTEYNQSWRPEPKKKRKPSANREHYEQVAVFNWAKFQKKRTPELALLFAIPNGGKRNKMTANALRAEGVKPGVPDICLPVARGKYHGLWIELKAPGGKPATDLQSEWLEALTAQGYYARVCVGSESAKTVIQDYLNETL